MNTITLAAAAVLLAAVPAAAAQDTSRAYGSLGYSRVETPDSELGAITLRGGYKLMPFVGVEAETSIGIEDDTFEVSIGGSGGTIELKHDIAAYAVAFLPLGDNVELFARAGYGSTSIEASVPGVTAFGDGESFNYGAGGTLFHGDNGLRADWTRRDFTDDGGEADVWSLSYVRRF